MNIDEPNIFVLGQATPSDLNLVNPSAICPIDHFRVTTYPLIQSLGGACCFDRPSQGGAWYTHTCPVVIVRIVQEVYDFSRNKLQQKVSQRFLVNRGVLYNILKV